MSEILTKSVQEPSGDTKSDENFLKLDSGSEAEGDGDPGEEISWFRLSGFGKQKAEAEESDLVEEERHENDEPDDEEKELMELVFGNKEKVIENLKSHSGKSTSQAQSQKRKHAWRDSDDEEVTIEEGLQKSHKKSMLLDPKTEYKKFLEKKHQKMVGTPKWAQLDREPSDSDEDEEDDLLKTAGHVLKGKKGALLENSIEFKKLRDLNRSTYCEGLVTSVSFHPTSSVALVTGLNGIASIYSIEKTKCDKLHSILFERFPLKCSRLSLDGSEAILGGSERHFFTYNLLTGQKKKQFLPKNINKMAKFEISPDGKLLAIAGRFGEIHLFHATTKEWIVTLKQEHEVSALTFSPDSTTLFAHSVDSEVSVFDLREQKMQHRFYDDGCLSGTTISVSHNGKFLATGSGQGIVNVYSTPDVWQSQIPAPVKIFKNLVTSISCTAFNPSSELLAMCSSEVNDALKLAHFPSTSIYSNFPGNNLTKSRPTVLSFSPGGRFLAVGNTNSKVSLYLLKHFEEF